MLENESLINMLPEYVVENQLVFNPNFATPARVDAFLARDAISGSGSSSPSDSEMAGAGSAAGAKDISLFRRQKLSKVFRDGRLHVRVQSGADVTEGLK